jgi:hypothetical protein
MLPHARACERGRHTRSSLHTGMISTEYVNLKLAVLLCFSDEISCSEPFILDRQRGYGSRHPRELT